MGRSQRWMMGVLALGLLESCSTPTPKTASNSNEPSSASKDCQNCSRQGETTHTTPKNPGDHPEGADKIESPPPPVERYCSAVDSLEIAAEIGPELSHFCADGTPTAEMLAFRDQLEELGLDERTEMQELSFRQLDDEITEMALLRGYRIRLNPEETKDRPLNDYLAKSLTNDTVDLGISTSERSSKDSYHEQHLWQATLNYELKNSRYRKLATGEQPANGVSHVSSGTGKQNHGTGSGIS